ncbi:hypothetical protein OG921_25155 [Aldersonia sp. NBC_00410]|uniref:hypothetical protein n=1 Tax=Aldersonia sp. NBC_00410 TaxID=2975954 RepID=UPI002253EDBA|nr:hypothetical protein [Aldersonia sp. NBC_00410]MCX5046464.1 hypothetical protein [Aldersonia sp. NBC_00410]
MHEAARRGGAGNPRGANIELNPIDSSANVFAASAALRCAAPRASTTARVDGLG